jgi:ABC-type polysaccharide/polyol phosphate export permease
MSATAVQQAPPLKAVRDSRPRFRRWQAARQDMVGGLQNWRIWWILSLTEIRQRYRRSSVGQFWLTLSMAASIAGIGITFGVIFNQPLGSYVPFLGIGMIIWALMAGLVNDLASSFIASETYLVSYPGPRSTVIYTVIVRNLITAAHNIILIPILWVIFGVEIGWQVLLVIPGLGLLVLNAVWLGMLIGPLCTRFRDLPQLIMNVMQLAFFITPIMFRPAQVQDKLWVLTHFNPFASFLELLRAPLLGSVPEASHYILVFVITVIGYAIALPFYARFRERIVYWL